MIDPPVDAGYIWAEAMDWAKYRGRRRRQLGSAAELWDRQTFLCHKSSTAKQRIEFISVDFSKFRYSISGNHCQPTKFDSTGD